MFKLGLLTSTAMTAVALLLSGAPVQAQDGIHVADRDTNSRFLCTYGFTVQYFLSAQSSWYSSRAQQAAVPITGKGQTVKNIIVMEGRNSRSSNSTFSAGIYSNHKGLPGKLIAGGKGKASGCGQVTISIPRTTLQPKTRYWIGEKAVQVSFSSSFTSLMWVTNPKSKHKAWLQSYRRVCSSTSCSSTSSPWTEQASGPWFKLK